MDDDYPSYLSDTQEGLAEPGLSANGLTVGGEARSNSALPGYSGVAPGRMHPSPFSWTVSVPGKDGSSQMLFTGPQSDMEQSLNVLAPTYPATSVIVASNEPGGQTFDCSAVPVSLRRESPDIAAEESTHIRDFGQIWSGDWRCRPPDHLKRWRI